MDDQRQRKQIYCLLAGWVVDAISADDIMQFYEPTRDYEKLIENSTVLWERK